MPRPNLPPTPSSTDISGREKPQPPSLEMSFTLPPPAMSRSASGSDRSSASPSSKSSDSSYHPASPPLERSPTASRHHRRRASSNAQAKESDFALPPPPTRSRKIIHMKPKGQELTREDAGKEKGKMSVKTTPSASTAAGSKRKQPSSTSVAGRKIARKTAHSLIERRRRSKMNEEFGTLKDMIPACTGQEMHKLAILQASIDYLRYLEQCVTDLKAANSNPPPSVSQTPANGATPVPVYQASPSAPFHSPTFTQHPHLHATSPVFSPTATNPQSMNFTPSMSLPSPAVDAVHERRSISQAISTSISTSTMASPALLPQNTEYQQRQQADGDGRENRMAVDNMDHEATAALLMLNADRRGSQTLPNEERGLLNRGVGKGMSVRDLLST